MIKALSTLGIGGNFLNMILKALSITNPQLIYSMVKTLKAFSLRPRRRQGCPLLPFLFNIVMEVFVRAIRLEKEIKSFQNGKEEVNYSYS